MYSGNKAIDYLASEIQKDDVGESSHWKMYHSDFKYTGVGFEGIQGFGGNAKSYKGLTKILHTKLQGRFRKMGKDYKNFDVIDNLASDITEKQGRAYDLDVLRQSLTLAFLTDKLSEINNSPNTTACLIGDGFASMTSLILASGFTNTVILVNLTKTLLVDLHYLKLWMGDSGFESSVDLVTDLKSITAALSKKSSKSDDKFTVIAIQAENHELLRHCPIDIAINIASMQEMNPSTIAEYFEDFRMIATVRELYFYCCNREEKMLPDGTITRFSEYPWNKNDIIINDELCPWHQQYYVSKPPFYHKYDGPIRQRLAVLK